MLYYTAVVCEKYHGCKLNRTGLFSKIIQMHILTKRNENVYSKKLHGKIWGVYRALNITQVYTRL